MSAIRPDRRDRATLRCSRNERGFAIVSAIFLIVVLAGLAVFMVSFASVQAKMSEQDIQGAKAYQAARTGIEWGAYQLLQVSGAGTFAASCQLADTTQTLTTLAGALEGFQVDVLCKKGLSYDEGLRTGANPLWMYQLQATGKPSSGAAGQSSYVERQVQVTIAK